MQIPKQFFLLQTFIILTTFFLISVAFSRDDMKDKHIVNLIKFPADRPTYSVCNIGQWCFWANYNGQTGHNPFTGSGGGYFPRGITSAIYMDGVMWGGIMRSGESPRLRVGGMTFRIGTVPGWIEANGQPVSVDNPRVRIYRIRSDWKFLSDQQVKEDAGELYNVVPMDVTAQMKEAIREQYKADWKEWPTDLGAPFYDEDGNGLYNPVLDEDGFADPAKGDFPGIANANQVLWWVVNDLNAEQVFRHTGCPPMGLELQITLWAYQQPENMLGRLIFKKYKLINKSGTHIDSMFIGHFSDPDIGDYADDLVGCDSSSQFHYAYNSGPEDAEYKKYNYQPPAVGYYFFQGPIVPGMPADQSQFNMDYRQGFKNLRMTSFTYLEAGGTWIFPPFGVYDYALQFYNMLNGYLPTNDTLNPTPYRHGSGLLKGHPTKFPLDGDPVSDPLGLIGDVGGQGDNPAPADHRMMASSGPFTMSPSDTQEVIVALAAGLGEDNLSSITDLKKSYPLVQKLRENLFRSIPRVPSPPRVSLSNLEDMIILNWGIDPFDLKRIESSDPYTNYAFEGYNVYQLPEANSSMLDAQKIAVFDKINGVTYIRGSRYSREFGEMVEATVQHGTDSGVQRYFNVDWDYLNRRPLYRGSTYHFAVSAYYYSPEPFSSIEKSYETQPAILTTVHQGPKPGVRYLTEFSDTIAVNYNGSSDGTVKISTIDPSAVTGHDYRITFEVDGDSASDTFGQTLWNLLDVTANALRIEKQRQLEQGADGRTAPIADGLLVQVYGVEPDFKDFLLVANAAGPVIPPNFAAFAFLENGFPTETGYDKPQPGFQSSNYSRWGIHAAKVDDISRDYDFFKKRIWQDGANTERCIPYDFEIRFTGSSLARFINAYGETANVPFELWNIGRATPDDVSDDVRMIPYIFDSDSNQQFNLTRIDHPISDGDNDPQTDEIFWRNPVNMSFGDAGYQAWAGSGDSVYVGAEVMAHMALVNWNGGSVSAYNWPENLKASMLENGTILRILTNKPNSPADTFAFTVPANVNSSELAKQDVDRISVFPNPYYGSHELERDRFDEFVSFTHLPRRATIRIFNLAGLVVRKIEKDDDAQFLKWNLQNEHRLLVASGMYIVHIEMPELKKTKVLKLLIIQSVQMPDYF